MQSSQLNLSHLLNDTQDTWPIDPGLSTTATAPAAESVSLFRFVSQTPAESADVSLFPSVSQTPAESADVSLFPSVSQTPAESADVSLFSSVFRMSAESTNVAEHLKVARASNQVKSTSKVRQLKAKPISLIADATPVRVKTSQWSPEERELLLKWLGRDLSHYEAMKLRAKHSCLKISNEVFKGSRSPESIRGQWELLKRKYYKARERLNSTGEGITSKDCQDRDSDKWTSIKISWLNKMCLHYEQIDDILKRDRAVTPLFVSEVGGTSNLKLVEGKVVTLSDSEDDILERSPFNDDDDLHPPAGGQKIPTYVSSYDPQTSIKKGESKGGTGIKALKRKRKTTAEEAIENIAERRLLFEQKRLDYERERDAKALELMREKRKK